MNVPVNDYVFRVPLPGRIETNFGWALTGDTRDLDSDACYTLLRRKCDEIFEMWYALECVHEIQRHQTH